MEINYAMADIGYQNFKIDSQGRALIPKSIRDALHLQQGDELIGSLENGKLVLESRQSLLARLQARYAEVEGSLADELMAERREETARE